MSWWDTLKSWVWNPEAAERARAAREQQARDDRLREIVGQVNARHSYERGPVQQWFREPTFPSVRDFTQGARNFVWNPETYARERAVWEERRQQRQEERQQREEARQASEPAAPVPDFGASPVAVEIARMVAAQQAAPAAPAAPAAQAAPVPNVGVSPVAAEIARMVAAQQAAPAAPAAQAAPVANAGASPVAAEIARMVAAQQAAPAPPPLLRRPDQPAAQQAAPAAPAAPGEKWTGPGSEEWIQEQWDKSLADRAPNRTAAQFLQDAGWQIPSAALPPELEQDLSLLDMDAARDLSGYSWKISPEEYAQMEAAYGGQRNYVAPDRPEDTGAGVLAPLMQLFPPAAIAMANSDVKEQRQWAENLPPMSSNITRSAPMTQEAYDALTPEQQRAVQFNTLFLEAREKDLAMRGADVPRNDRKEFEQRMERVFGDRGRDAEYAPNVLRLLDENGFTFHDSDLDDFLSLERLVTLDEMSQVGQGLDHVALNEDATNYATARTSVNLTAQDMGVVQQAGPLLDRVLSNPDAWNFESAVSLELTGAVPEGVDIPFGYGTDEIRLASDSAYGESGKDDWFRDRYEMLSDREVENLDLLWEDAYNASMSDEDIQELWEYFDLKTRRDMEMGLTPEEGRRSPEEIRQMIGLEEM